MPKIIPFDTLAYAKKLESRGVDVKHAEAHAETLAEAFESTFTTKQETNTVIIGLSQEITLLRHDMDKEFVSVRTAISTLRSEMVAEFVAVRTEISSLRSEMAAEFVAVRSDMTIGFYKQKWENIRWVLGIAFTQTALIASIMASMFKFFH